MVRLPRVGAEFVYTWDELLDGALHTVHIVHDGWYRDVTSLQAKAYREAASRSLSVKTHVISPQELTIQARNPWTRRHPMWAYTQAQLTGAPYPECTCGAFNDQAHQGWCGMDPAQLGLVPQGQDASPNDPAPTQSADES